MKRTEFGSSPLDTTEFLDEAAATQQAIDELTGQGVDHIVVLPHFGLDNDPELAPQLGGST